MTEARADPADAIPAEGSLLQLAAFTTDPAGGNPAGVWIGRSMPPDVEMQRIATEVGYSETALVSPDGSPRLSTSSVSPSRDSRSIARSSRGWDDRARTPRS